MTSNALAIVKAPLEEESHSKTQRLNKSKRTTCLSKRTAMAPARGRVQRQSKGVNPKLLLHEKESLLSLLLLGFSAVPLASGCDEEDDFSSERFGKDEFSSGNIGEENELSAGNLASTGADDNVDGDG